MSNSTASKAALRVSRGVLNIFLSIIFYTVLILVIARASRMAYDFAYQVFGSAAKEDSPGFDIEIQVVESDSVFNIAQKLETKGVIANKYSFYVKAKLMQSSFAPGVFILNTSMDYGAIIEIMTDPSKSIQEE